MASSTVQSETAQNSVIIPESCTHPACGPVVKTTDETSPNYRRLSYLTICASVERGCTTCLKSLIYVQFDLCCSRNHLRKSQGQSDSPPSMSINTFEHRDQPRHSRSCQRKASGQAEIPTWRVPVPVNQMFCGEAGWG